MPSLYPILLTAAIIGSGMMPLGYAVVDEVLAGVVVLGALWALRGGRGEVSEWDAGRLPRLHLVVFLIMVAYFELQAIRGMIVLESLRKVRWVLFFPLMGLIPIVLRLSPHTRWTAEALARPVLWSALAYTALSLLVAVIWEALGGSRWSLQGTWWVPTAYAALPVVAAMPYVMYGLNQGRRLRRAGWAVLAILIVSAFYFDSRLATLAILAFLAAGFSTYRLRGLVIAAGLMAAALLFIAPFVAPGRRLADTMQEAGELVKSFVTIFNPPERFIPHHDMERYIHLQVAGAALRKDWRSMVFGYGFRVHGRVISPELKILYERYGAPEIAARIRDDESTVGFTALTVDTGLLGFGLFMAAHVLVAARVWAGGNRRYRLPTLLAVVLLFFWQFAVNTLDAVLVYMLLMPGGPLQLLAESGAPAAAAG